jgi:RNA polymerase sigma factor (sigma-70 family)
MLQISPHTDKSCILPQKQLRLAPNRMSGSRGKLTMCESNDGKGIPPDEAPRDDGASVDEGPSNAEESPGQAAAEGSIFADLFRRAFKGEPAAIDALMDWGSPRMLRVALGLRLTEADALDIVQEVWINLLWNQEFDFRGESSLLAYLRSGVYNNGLSLLRKRQRRKERSLDTSNDDVNSGVRLEIEGREPDPRDALILAEKLGINSKHLKACMKELKELERAIIQLHYFNDISFIDVSQTLGLTTKEGKTAAHSASNPAKHAILKLRRCMEAKQSTEEQ